jgi:putative transposase
LAKTQVSKSARPGAPVPAPTPVRILFDVDFSFADLCSFVTSFQTAVIYARRVPKLLKRFYGAGDLHFITCSCYKRRPVLGTASRRDLFLTVLERVRRRYRLVVIGYVVMPEHFHLLITEPQVGDPSVVMQALKLGFARRIVAEMARAQVSKGARPGAPGSSPGSSPSHVWAARFYDFNVYTERKRVEKLRYIHRNPVERGLVTEPDQWLWSSFRFYMYGEVGAVRVNDWQLLELRATGPAASASPDVKTALPPSQVSKSARPGAPVLRKQKLFGS